MGRFLRRLLALGIFIYALGLLWTVYYIATFDDPDPLPGVAHIVVLSGPFGEEPGDPDETSERVLRGIELFEAGLAPSLIMSGGGSRAFAGPGDAAFMSAQAQEAGVPEDAILTETESHSTLQNAWNTARLEAVDPTAPVLLVTHRYHLSRAAASFRWAGFSDVTPVAADLKTAQTITLSLLLEGVKWPVNVLRAAGATIALAFDVPEETVRPWLH